MNLHFLRALFVLISGVLGLQLTSVFFGIRSQYGLYGVLAGAALAIVVIWIEKSTQQVSLRGMSAAIFGLLLALIISNLLSRAVDSITLSKEWAISIKLVTFLILSYLGIVLSMRGRDEFNIVIPYVKFQRMDHSDMNIIVDTSILIDGRLPDLLKTSFVEGNFIIPRFVLKELQMVADSSDDIKRKKGRRGLDVLARLKRNSNFHFKIHHEDFPDLREVDQKLIKLAQILDAKIMTTDYNLNKVAEFYNIKILNIHELSIALKTLSLPGEVVDVLLVKEGKEKEQAVAYLDDGTMIVVEGGRPFLGQHRLIVVTSILQTSAGRMVFAKIQEEAPTSAQA